MRRPPRFTSSLVRVSTLLLLSAAAPAAAEGPVWPGPPADPVVRLESVLSKLGGFEIAVQGPTEAPPRRVQKLKRPSGIAFDARGRLLVSDGRQGVLLQIDPDLGVVLVIGTGTTPSLRDPRGIAVDGEGIIYVADAELRQVVAFAPSGEISGVYGQGDLSEPTDVAVTPDGGRLYVADASANEIAIFDRAERRRVGTFGQRGSGAAEFILPSAVEFDAAGNLLVTDQLNGRVQIFDRDGAFTRALYLGGPGRPYDVAADAIGRLYVSDRTQSRIQIYDSDLEPMLTLGRNGLRDGEFLAIGAVATSGDRLAALDQAGGRVQLFRLSRIDQPSTAIRMPESTWQDPSPAPEREDPAPLEATRLAEPEAVEAPGAAVRADAGADEGAGAAEPSATESTERTAVEAMEGADQAMPAAGPEPVEPPARGAEAATADAGPAVMTETADEEPARAEMTDPQARLAQELLDLVQAWAAAWSDQDVERYLGFYSLDFRPAGGASRDEWAALRRSRVTAPASISVEVELVETRIEEGAAEVTFVQSYASDRFSDRVHKRLRLVPEADGWKIARETVLEEL